MSDVRDEFGPELWRIRETPTILEEWRERGSWTAEEAAWLLLGYNPIITSAPKSDLRLIEGAYKAALDHLNRATKGGELNPTKSLHKLHYKSAETIKWALKRKKLWPDCPFGEKDVLVPSTVGKWPWGDYETTLLQLLAAAASKFCVNYDPEDDETWELKDTIVSWLIDHAEKKFGYQLSQNQARAIYTVLTPENIKPGPRVAARTSESQ